jgi:hypothetical protein
MRKLVLVGVLCVTAGCTSIVPYSVRVATPNHTLLPPSAQLTQYTESVGLSAQLERSTAFCGHVKQMIAKEIDERAKRLSTRRSVLLLIGSAAALGTTIYSGIEDTPDKKIVVPLSAISGSALLTAIPSLAQDERAEALKEKLAAVKAKEGIAIEAWNALERGLLDVSLLRGRQESLQKGSDDWRSIQTDLDRKYVEIAPIEDRLRGALASLSNECS